MTFRKKNNKKARTYRGTEYRSEWEVTVRKGLSRLKRKLRSKAKIDYERDTLPYVIERNYTPDFTITKEDGSVVYVEAKGYFDRNAMTKMHNVIEQHPDKEIVFLFSNDRPVRKGSKTKYSDWCEKRGVDYAINEIPERWFKTNG